MEARQVGARDVGAREADVAPAPEAAAPAAGWTPANPGPLGLAAFALTTFVLSMLNANLVAVPRGVGAVLPLTLVYGGLVQLLAGMWEFRTGNTFGAVAFSSYGGFWIALYVFFHQAAVLQTHQALSLYLWGWSIFTVLMLVASLRTTAALAGVFLILTITFFLLAIGNASLVGTTATTNGTIKLGGWFGIVTAAAAWYVAFAAVLASTFGREILPVFPFNR